MSDVFAYVFIQLYTGFGEHALKCSAVWRELGSGGNSQSWSIQKEMGMSSLCICFISRIADALATMCVAFPIVSARSFYLFCVSLFGYMIDSCG